MYMYVVQQTQINEIYNVVFNYVLYDLYATYMKYLFYTKQIDVMIERGTEFRQLSGNFPATFRQLSGNF